MYNWFCGNLIWFYLCVVGMIATMPFRFYSLEHTKLQKKYGKERGIRIGDTIGMIQGWAFYIFWMGVWISPQPRFTIPIFQNVYFTVPFINLTIPLVHLIIFTPLIVAGAWLGIKGVQATTLKVAETHRTDKIVEGGVYSLVRHPQYLGGLLSHVGISFLLSGTYSLVFTAVVVVLIYIMSWKEEKELIKEFGKEYEDYKKKVPMLIPGLKGLRK